MKKYLLLLLLVGSALPMEQEPAEAAVPHLTIPQNNLEDLARAEHHHSMTITVSEDETYGTPPLSPKTIEHQYAMKKMRWGLVIAVVGGVGGILAAFFGTFFGKSCP